jgi:non-specific protein-tyrosine kinase
MRRKIKETIALLNARLKNNKYKTPDIAGQNDSAKNIPKQQYNAQTDIDKYEKAIVFFKQRRRNGGQACSTSPERDFSEAILGIAADDIPAISSEITVHSTLEAIIVSPGKIPDSSGQNTTIHEPLQEKHQAETETLAKAESFFEQRQRDEGASMPESSVTYIQEVLSESPKEVINEAVPENTAKASCEAVTVNSGLDTAKEQAASQAGWLSPQYLQSRRVQLEPKFIAEKRCLVHPDNVLAAEAYKILRTQIVQRTRRSASNTIMVTSALPGEGKTLASINLAFSLSREFRHTVLLIDGDLRKQTIHKYLGYESKKGLIDYLADNAPLSELITWPGIEKITLISGGCSFQESAEMLGSPRMKELITDMKSRYPERYILFDVPPVLSSADALTFAPLVDYLVFVVQAGKTSVDDVRKAIQLFPKEKIIGFVLNRGSIS